MVQAWNQGKPTLRDGLIGGVDAVDVVVIACSVEGAYNRRVGGLKGSERS